MDQQEPIMQFFKFDHLPPEKQAVSRPFHELAVKIHELPRNPERSVALRKLLEAKDAAVRASFMVLLALLFVLPARASAAAGVPAPTFAIAQAEQPAPPPSVFGEFAKQFLTPQGIASAVLTVLGLIAGAAGLSAQRKRQVAIVTEHAFHCVEDFAATTESDIDDKVALGLKKADEWMRAQGWRPLKPGEVEVVKLGFSALNGATKVSEKIAEAAAVPPKP